MDNKTSILIILSIILVLLADNVTMSLNAVVTGANRGLGLELCRQLLDGNVYSQIYALCRKSSTELTSLANEESSASKLVIVENVEITKPVECTPLLQSTFATLSNSPIPIHLLVHNAGAYGPPKDSVEPKSMYASQTLSNITVERMQFAFELNTMAPLFVTQALLPNLKVAATKDVAGKIAIITSLMGSLDDNTSGGHYGYRTAKAGVNMIGKSLSVDLKEDNIAVGLIHPGFVHTGFGGQSAEKRPGQRDTQESTKGVMDAINALTMDTTGSFVHGNYGEGIKPMKW